MITSPSGVVIAIGSMPTSSQKPGAGSSASSTKSVLQRLPGGVLAELVRRISQRSGCGCVLRVGDDGARVLGVVLRVLGRRGGLALGVRVPVARRGRRRGGRAEAGGQLLVDLGARDHRVERVDDLVPALVDHLGELGPQRRAVAPAERRRAGGQGREGGRRVEDLVHDREVADVGERAAHGRDLGEVVQGPGVGVLGDELRDADDVVALHVLGGQLVDRELDDHGPGGVVGEVVLLARGLRRRDPGREVGGVREREQRVVVAEEGLPFLAVLAPPRGPQRDEVAGGERQRDRDDVLRHTGRASASRGEGVRGAPYDDAGDLPVPARFPRSADTLDRMDLLRTPDDRFDDLAGFPLAPRWVEVANPDGGAAIRVATYAAGPTTPRRC